MRGSEHVFGQPGKGIRNAIRRQHIGDQNQRKPAQHFGGLLVVADNQHIPDGKSHNGQKKQPRRHGQKRAAIAHGHNIAHNHGQVYRHNQQSDHHGHFAAILLPDQLNQALFGFLANPRRNSKYAEQNGNAQHDHPAQ